MTSSPGFWLDRKPLRWAFPSLLGLWRARIARSGVRTQSPEFLRGGNDLHISRPAAGNCGSMDKASPRPDPRLAPNPWWHQGLCLPSCGALCEVHLPGHLGTEREDCCPYRFDEALRVAIEQRSSAPRGWQQPRRPLSLLVECQSCCSCSKTER